MYSNKDLKRVLRRNLDSEFDIIKFYLDNLERFNYPSNKKKIDRLVLDSIRHSRMISESLLFLGSGAYGKLSPKHAETALREESAVKHIYAYELARTNDKKTKNALKRLIEEETAHERLVKSLK
jgi:rubrerythrin